MLKQLQTHFFDYLLHGDQVFAEDIISASTRGQDGSTGLNADLRLQIYANAYRARLSECLNNDHEMLGLYLGDELYDQMVAGYIEAYPSHYVSLRHFGENLPAFLRRQAPFSEHPILAELAAFERLLLTVFDAAEAPRLRFTHLQALPSEQWPALRLQFHPSVQLFVCEYNTVESWQALKKQSAPEPAHGGARACWLLWRGHDQLTQFRSIKADEEALLRGFLQGANFAENCSALLEWYGEAQVPGNALRILYAWFDDGLVRSLS